MTHEIKNLSASVIHRLSNIAKEKQINLQQVLEHYAMERFLYRMTCSEYKDAFVLKGGLAFNAWNIPFRRFTRDIDLRGFTDNSVTTIVEVFKEICNLPVHPDGMEYLAKTVQGSIIQANADYQGVRVNFLSTIGQVKIAMHIDLDFDDIITPQAVELHYPTLLNMPQPQLRTYPLATIVAEKLETMVSLSAFNSRMKDYYDLWLLSRHFDFDGQDLSIAIKNTFEQRKTKINVDLPLSSTDYITNKGTMWRSFQKRNLNTIVDIEFSVLASDLQVFFHLPLESLVNNLVFDKTWKAGEEWL